MRRNSPWRRTREITLHDVVGRWSNKKGSPYTEAVWLWPAAAGPNGGFPQHVHDHDEVLGFFGTDTGKVLDLGGEIEFWLENEKYLLTKSCLIFVPKGMKHCPIVFRRIDRPIFHFLIVTGGEYR